MKKLLFPTIVIVLVIGFWISPEFQIIAGGVAIFLFGMLYLEQGFSLFSGGALERVLSRATDTTWKSLAFGIGTTSVMQSSSLVSVITISFLSAELIPLAAGIGIIFGANIGTTTGAWLIAGFGLKVKLSAYALPMLVIAVILNFQSSKYLRGGGAVLAGLGFIFLGIHFMKEGFADFSSQIDLLEYAVPGRLGLLIFTAIGAVATVIMQSSHATVVLVITALAAGQVSYENALALAIGANIGTTVTAIIGSLTANYQGKRLAAAHLIFNLSTAAVALLLIDYLRDMVEWSSDMLGIAATDYTLKLAVFHTIFNVLGVILMTPLINRLVHLLERVIATPKLDVSRPRYLNDSVIAFPEASLVALRKEVLHLYENAFEIIAHGLNLSRRAILTSEDLGRTVRASHRPIEFDLDQRYEQQVRHLYAAIVEFTTRLGDTDLPPSVADEVYRLRQAASRIVECVKSIKHLRKNILNFTVRAKPRAVAEIYNDLRTQIADLLVVMNNLETSDENERTLLSLEEDRLQIEHGRRDIDARLDRLIRERQIEPAVATSFMNDTNYAYTCMINLIEIARTLYREADPAMFEVERILAIDEDDVADLVERDTPSGPTPEMRQ